MEQRESIKDKRVAVTGATGMLGGELVKQLLALGVRPLIVARNSARLQALYDFLGYDAALDVAETELTNPVELKEAFAGVDMVFHCAAKVSFRQGEAEDIVRTNTDITRHIVNACIGAGVGKLVHVSSIASLSPVSGDGRPVDENCCPDNITGWNGYSTSKYYSENEVWWGVQQGLKAVIVNPSVILGPGDWSGYGSAALYARLAKGMPFYTEGVTGYVDVRDVAGAMIELAGTPAAEGRRFILSSENLSYRELITKVAKSAGKKAPRIRVGRGVLSSLEVVERLMGKITGREPLLTKGVIKTAVTKSHYDSGAVKGISGFSFRPVDETISYMAAEYEKYKKNE